MSTTSSNPSSPPTTSPTSATSTTSPPPATSSNSSSTSSASPTTTGYPDGGPMGMTNYYYVFFAVIICVAGLVGFFLWRRRRAILENHATYGERQLWTRRRISVDTGREEGLNEHGEAPPPYMPKYYEQPGREGPAMPMQTLSRDEAGLPPDYETGRSNRCNTARTPG